jgi:hypothetical protein
VVGFWLAGAAAVAVYAALGGIEPAGRPLETVSAARTPAVVAAESARA